MEDEAIIELLFARSELAVAELDAKYGPLLRSLALRLLSDEEDEAECLALAIYAGARALTGAAAPEPTPDADLPVLELDAGWLQDGKGAFLLRMRGFSEYSFGSPWNADAELCALPVFANPVEYAPVEQNRVTLIPGEDGRLRSLRLEGAPESLGNYPLISLEEATELVLNGGELPGTLNTLRAEDIVGVTLVYHIGMYDEYYAPYYCFAFAERESGEMLPEGFAGYSLYYVPAVSGEYLSPGWDGGGN